MCDRGIAFMACENEQRILVAFAILYVTGGLCSKDWELFLYVMAPTFSDETLSWYFRTMIKWPSDL